MFCHIWYYLVYHMIVTHLFLRQVPGLRRYTNNRDCFITFPDLEFLLQKYSAANPR